MPADNSSTNANHVAQCVISFGSNLGNRHELIAEAARKIAKSPLMKGGVFCTSRLFETPPIGGPKGQAPFLNAIAAFETHASARDVLGFLQATEQDLGRRRHQRWDARSIDLDVVLHGELVGGGTGLTVPHPRYTARRFVLRPACDVAGHFRDPRFGWTLDRLRQHLSEGLPSMALVGDLDTRQEICQRLANEHGIRTFVPGPNPQPMAVVGNAPAPAQTSNCLPQSEFAEPIHLDSDAAWIAGYVPPLPKLSSDATSLPTVPRLVARIQRTTPATAWPAPHQMWPAGWDWPEYRLEVDDLDWAVKELASALDSMRCAVEPVTQDGTWW